MCFKPRCFKIGMLCMVIMFLQGCNGCTVDDITEFARFKQLKTNDGKLRILNVWTGDIFLEKDGKLLEIEKISDSKLTKKFGKIKFQYFGVSLSIKYFEDFLYYNAKIFPIDSDDLKQFFDVIKLFCYNKQLVLTLVDSIGYEIMQLKIPIKYIRPMNVRTKFVYYYATGKTKIDSISRFLNINKKLRCFV